MTSEKQILERLEAQCAKREYCSADIFKKALQKMEGDKDAAQRITASLVENGFVDDLRYASAFAREKASLTGWGPVKIRFQLRAKNIPSQTINQALEEIESDKADRRLLRLMQAKWKTLEGDPQARLKLLKFALSRGYEYDAIQAFLPEVCSTRDDS